MTDQTASQNAVLLHALKFGRRVTPMAALRLWGIFRLSARVYELRQRGVKIKSGSVSIRGKRFAEYWL